MLKPYRLIENLKRFKNPTNYALNSVWPPNRRSAVLILLFIGNRGEVRVLLTTRSRKLRSFAGHVSLPGGKADSADETFDMVARREAMEEIGLPLDPVVLQEQFNMKIDKVSSELPCYMSRTLLSVKPVVYFLYNKDNDGTKKYTTPLNVINFFGKLNPGETSSIFSIPINDLIHDKLRQQVMKTNNNELIPPEYLTKHSLTKKWGGLKWTVKHFHYPTDNHADVAWLNQMEDLSASSSDGETIEAIKAVKYRDVWGLTAKMLTDVAMVGNDIEFSEARSLGHEELIHGLRDLGHQFQPEGRSEWELGLINDKPGVAYSDVLPDDFIQILKKHSLSF